MKIICFLSYFTLLAASLDWFSKKEDDFTIFYRDADKANIRQYSFLIKKGMKKVKGFFRAGYKNQFVVYVHPGRNSLDSSWRHDWKMPEFKSECWMVASGIADRLDMISPRQWSKQSCEHDYSNKEETQKLITHELVHVFHAQLNKSKDFGETENLDWFVEGLAAYASGQLNEEKISEVRQAISDNQTPSSLNDFWKGKMRYQQSGSVVMFIDKTYGRKKLISLLPLATKREVLFALNTSEDELLSNWKSFMLNNKASG